MAVSDDEKRRDGLHRESRSTKPNCASWSSACSTRRAARAPACSSSAPAAERLGKLTAREHQVLERIIAGRLNKQIADDLGISIKTVEAHRANIMEKLNVNTVADLLRLALSNKAATGAINTGKRRRRVRQLPRPPCGIRHRPDCPVRLFLRYLFCLARLGASRPPNADVVGLPARTPV